MELQIGLSVTKTMIVQEKDSARNVGSGGLDVFATPAMLAFMENVALEMVRPYLSEGSDSVGTSADVKHLKAAPIGSAISCTATITSIEGARLQFTIECFDEGGDLIGTSRHGRYIIDIDRFLSKLKV